MMYLISGMLEMKVFCSFKTKIWLRSFRYTASESGMVSLTDRDGLNFLSPFVRLAHPLDGPICECPFVFI